MPAGTTENAIKEPRNTGSAPTDHAGEPLVEQSGYTEQDVQRRAYEIHLARGSAPGAELEDWLQAEREFQLPQRDATRE